MLADVLDPDDDDLMPLLAHLTALAIAVDDARAAIVVHLRDQDEATRPSWQAIADAAGVTRQSAWRRWSHPEDDGAEGAEPPSQDG